MDIIASRSSNATHRFRKNVYGTLPYSNLVRCRRLRGLSTISGTCGGKNKEPVTSNRRARTSLTRLPHRESASDSLDRKRVTANFLFMTPDTASPATYFSIVELFLNSQAIRFTKAFGYTRLQMHVELNILGRRKYEMKCSSRIAENIRSWRRCESGNIMLIRNFLLATTCLLEYSQYMGRRFKNITVSNININFETLAADLMPSIRFYNKRDRWLLTSEKNIKKMIKMTLHMTQMTMYDASRCTRFACICISIYMCPSSLPALDRKQISCGALIHPWNASNAATGQSSSIAFSKQTRTKNENYENVYLRISTNLKIINIYLIMYKKYSFAYSDHENI